MGKLRTRSGPLTIVGLLLLSSVGCETLGLSPPANPLLPETKTIRNAAPVPAPGGRELAKELLPAHVVELGDTLLVQPVELDAPIRLPPDQPVQPDGTIDLGKYGRPVVVGKTLPQVEAQIKDIIAAGEKGKGFAVTVRLLAHPSNVYYVLGEVNAPGAYPLTGRETVLDGIVAAGLPDAGRVAGQHRVSAPDNGRRLPGCVSGVLPADYATRRYNDQLPTAAGRPRVRAEQDDAGRDSAEALSDAGGGVFAPAGAVLRRSVRARHRWRPANGDPLGPWQLAPLAASSPAKHSSAPELHHPARTALSPAGDLPVKRALLLAGLGAAGYFAYRALKPKYDFRDKHVLITGGSRGLGLVMARQPRRRRCSPFHL